MGDIYWAKDDSERNEKLMSQAEMQTPTTKTTTTRIWHPADACVPADVHSNSQ